jgi:methylmalonic aciduria homocystinuria type C protein
MSTARTTVPSPSAVLAARLAPAGLDLVRALDARRYDAAVAPEFRLPRPGGREARLAVVIGSSRAFWEPFLAWLRGQPSVLEHPDPIDRYTVQVVTAALAEIGVAHEARFSFEPPPRRVAMQRLADVAGLAALTPAMLCVHPTFGPWIALRAAVVFDVAPPDDLPPAPPLACHDCATRCTPALERAQQAVAARANGSAAEIERSGGDPVAPDWTLWLAVRDACPLGREHRYPDPYLRYVYTKDRGVLRAALAEPVPAASPAPSR